VAPEKRAERGLVDGLIRVSTGLENVEDLLADFERAFKAVAAGGSE
jgi:cystathionine beta-lyase/cystathionine gamma-synthase